MSRSGFKPGKKSSQRASKAAVIEQLEERTLLSSSLPMLYSTTGATSQAPNTLLTINASNGAQTKVGTNGQAMSLWDADVDPISGLIYGSASGSTIYVIDPTTGATTKTISVTRNGSSFQIFGLAFSPEGDLYASIGNLVGKIDPDAGTFTDQCIAYDSPTTQLTEFDFFDTDTMYALYTQYEPSTIQYLETVNITTGQATLINQITGFPVGDIACASDGYIYGSNFSTWLARVDPGSGVSTGLGSGTVSSLIAMAADGSTATPRPPETLSISDQEFSVARDAGNGDEVATVAAAGDGLQFSIAGGNVGGAFAIDPDTGLITVANHVILRDTADASFALTVQVTNDVFMVKTANVVIDLTDGQLGQQPGDCVVGVTVKANGSETSGATRGRAAVVFTRTDPTTSPLVIPIQGWGTADVGDDYEALPGSVTIPARKTSFTLYVPIVDDLLAEATETLNISIDDSADYSIGAGKSSAAVNILDNEPVVSVARTKDAKVSDDPTRTAGTFTVTRTGSTKLPLTVTYTVGGAATADTDYQSLSGTITIPAGKKSAVISVLSQSGATPDALNLVSVTLDDSSDYHVAANAATASLTILPGPATISLASLWNSVHNYTAAAKININGNSHTGTATIDHGTIWANDIGSGTNFLSEDFTLTSTGAGLSLDHLVYQEEGWRTWGTEFTSIILPNSVSSKVTVKGTASMNVPGGSDDLYGPATLTASLGKPVSVTVPLGTYTAYPVTVVLSVKASGTSTIHTWDSHGNIIQKTVHLSGSESFTWVEYVVPGVGAVKVTEKTTFKMTGRLPNGDSATYLMTS